MNSATAALLPNANAASIIAVFCAALAWASFGSVDIVATATGGWRGTSRSRCESDRRSGDILDQHCERLEADHGEWASAHGIGYCLSEPTIEIKRYHKPYRRNGIAWSGLHS
jgi:hypothetical protein